MTGPVATRNITPYLQQKLEWKQMDGRTDQQQYLDSYGVVQKGRAGLRN